MKRAFCIGNSMFHVKRFYQTSASEAGDLAIERAA
jgi:hypothetical protein